MEENTEDKILISRSKLERLEQDKNLLEVQLREERQKFKDSAKYCLKEQGTAVYWSEEYYTNDEVVNKLSTENKELIKELHTHESFWELHIYKQIMLCFKRKR